MAADAREEIAASLSAIPGINCTPYSRQTTKAGEGFVQFSRAQLSGSGLAFTETYRIVIVLHQDLLTSEKWIDEHGAEIFAALRRVLVGTTLAPFEMQIGSTVVNTVVVEGNR